MGHASEIDLDLRKMSDGPFATAHEVSCVRCAAHTRASFSIHKLCCRYLKNMQLV